MKSIIVKGIYKEYPVIIGHHLDNIIQECVDTSFNGRKVMLVFDKNIPLETRNHLVSLIDSFVKVDTYEFPGGEHNKNLQNVEAILVSLLEKNYTRSDALISVGGGITSDLVGTVAGLYKRGMRHANIATTTLAIADASVGGKCGVNLKGVKNAVGVFKDPEFVIADLEFLKSLDERQIRNGYFESVKMGITLDRSLFEIFERDHYEEAQEEILTKSIEAKAKIVAQDPTEKGIRRYLNFGHTMGHAIESTHLETMLHGESIALGMLYMIDNNPALKERVKAVLIKMGLDLSVMDTFKAEELLPYVASDKKAFNDSTSLNVAIVTVTDIEQVQCQTASLSDIEERINQYE